MTSHMGHPIPGDFDAWKKVSVPYLQQAKEYSWVCDFSTVLLNAIGNN